MPNAYGLRNDEEEEFQPGILPSQKKKRGLEEPSISTEGSPMDLMPEGRAVESKGLKSPVSEEDYGKRRDVGFREEGGIPDGKLPSERGLKEEGWLKETFARPFRWDQARLEKLQQENDLRDSDKLMLEGHRHLAKAVAAFGDENLPLAVRDLGRAYDQIPDGGGIRPVKPFDQKTIKMADEAGGVDWLIEISHPEGNIEHRPLDEDNVQMLLNRARAAYNPKTFITSTMVRKAANRESNKGQLDFPTVHKDGRVSHLHYDEQTGKRETIWSDSMQDFKDTYGAPHQGWKTPKGEAQEAKLIKERLGKTFTEEGRPISVEESARYKGKQYGVALPRTTKKAPTILDPDDMVKGRDEKGNEVNGWVINGKFQPMPNVSKILSKEGTITQKDIITMYKDFEKAYHSTFYGEKGYPDFQDTQTGKIIKGGSDEHIRDWVNKAMRRILPPEYQRPLPGLDEQIKAKGLSKPKTQLPPRDKEEPSKPGMRSISQPTTKKAKKTLVSVKRNKTTGDVVKIYSDGTRETIVAPPGPEATRKRIEPGVGVR